MHDIMLKHDLHEAMAEFQYLDQRLDDCPSWQKQRILEQRCQSLHNLLTLGQELVEVTSCHLS